MEQKHAARNKPLRAFGLIVGGIFTLLGLWPRVFYHQDVRAWELAIAALLILPAILMPRLLKWPHDVWMRIGHVLGWINSRIIMTVAFYAVFTPVGFIRRMQSDPMNRKLDREADTYRVKRESRHPSHMTHQY